jgi:hypothetical protein
MRLATAEALPGAPALVGRPVTAPHPLHALRAVAARVERDVSPHPIAGIRSWLYGDPAPAAVEFRASELVSGERVEELMSTAAALWGGSAHANAALAWKTYCYWTLAPAVLGYIAARRVPVMDAANSVFSVSDEAPMFSVRQVRPRFLALPHDPCAGHPDVEVVANEGDLLDRLRATMFEDHLGPVLDAFLARVRVGRRTLLGSLACRTRSRRWRRPCPIPTTSSRRPCSTCSTSRTWSTSPPTRPAACSTGAAPAAWRSPSRAGAPARPAASRPTAADCGST